MAFQGLEALLLTQGASFAFNSTNTYSGATLINSGTLSTGSDNALSPNSSFTVAAGTTVNVLSPNTMGALNGAGNVSVAAGATLSLGQKGTSASFSGIISGDGNIEKVGSARQLLSGTNSYTGSTTVTAGTLAMNTSSLTGDVITSSGATFEFNQTTTDTYSGVVSGAGSLLKSGVGALTLSGTNTYSGSTSVNGGELHLTGLLDNSLAISINNGGAFRVNNPLASGSTVTVNCGGVVKGVGPLEDVVSNGTVFPGNSIGTLVINGDYTQNSGSTLKIEFNDSDQADLLQVSGSANIQSGSKLTLVPQPGVYDLSESFTVLTAGGGVNGTFDFIEVSDEAGVNHLSAEVAYLGNSVVITLDLSLNGLGPILLPVSQALAVKMGNTQLNTVNQRLNEFLVNPHYCHFSNPCNQVIHFSSEKNELTNKEKKECKKRFVTLYASYGEASGTLLATRHNPALRYRINSPVIGVELTPKEHIQIGLGINYTNGYAKITNDQCSINCNNLGFNAYFQYILKDIVAFSAAGTVGYSDYSQARKTVFHTTSRSSPKGWFALSEIGAAARLFHNSCTKFKMYPKVTVRSFYYSIDGYTEEGELTRLRVHSNNHTDWSLKLGSTFALNIPLKKSILVPQLGVFENIPFNKHGKNIKVHNITGIKREYVRVDSYNWYSTIFNAGLSYFIKGINLFASSNYYLGRHQRSNFDFYCGCGVSF